MSKEFKHNSIIIAIPAYNEERYIAEAIRSVRAQDWTDFLAVISDNASTDRTEEICRREIASDPRFRYVRHTKNMGSGYNFNYLLEITESPYIMWLGAHDMITSDFIGDHLRALERLPSCSLSYSLTRWIDEAGNPLEVTNASELNQLQGSPLARYFGSVRALKECTPINNVLRRSAIGSARFVNVGGCDKVILSELLFRGPANLVAKPQYIRRNLPRDRRGYMENLSGSPNLRYDPVETAKLYIENFDKLLANHPGRFIIRLWFRLLLKRRVSHELKASSFARVMAFRLLRL